MSKDDDTSDKIIELQAICKELGWNIVLDDSAEYINGLVIGTQEFIDEIMSGDFDIDDFDIYVPGDQSDGGLH